jgi:hypothetical protein
VGPPLVHLSATLNGVATNCPTVERIVATARKLARREGPLSRCFTPDTTTTYDAN